MKKVFVTRKLLKENEQKLQELFEVKLNTNDKIYSAEEIIDVISVLRSANRLSNDMRCP